MTAVAALLRFAALGHKAFWLDEAFTVDYLHRSFTGMLSAVRASDANPPFYFVLGWGWTHLFGTSEAGIRSLSALASTVAVPFVYLAGRELATRAVGIAAAVLIAVNPFAVWYAQEARPYGVLLLTASIGLWCLARALRDPGRRWIVGWAVAGAAAIVTHYFAGVLVAAEFAWLMAVRRRRGEVALVALLPVAVGAGLTPFALDQFDAHRSDAIEVSLSERIARLPGGLLLGDERPGGVPVTAVACLLAAAALVLVARRGTPAVRRGALVAGSLAAVAIVVPVIAALAGSDHLLERYLTGGLVALVIVLGAGFACSRLGWLLGAALTLISLGGIVATVDRPKYGGIDSRDLARALEPLRPGTVVLVTPGNEAKPLRIYAPLRQVMAGSGPVAASEVDVVRPAGGALSARPPARGFRLVEQESRRGFVLAKWRASEVASLTVTGPDVALLVPSRVADR